MLKKISVWWLLTAFCAMNATASGHDPEILHAVLNHYYKSEKVVVKGRTQFLFLYCEQPPNNEEIFETINALKIPAAEAARLRKLVASDNATLSWNDSVETLRKNSGEVLWKKVNDCISVEAFQSERERRRQNNQRLMIVSRPLHFSGDRALVKVVFYRTIEHNSGSVLLMQKTGDGWQIKDFLNPWET